MPVENERWTGQIPKGASWLSAREVVTREEGTSRRLTGADRSPYHTHFSQGAVILPRVAFMVERQQAPALGLPAGRAAVRSHRSNNEKKPWKGKPSLEGIVETDFLRPVHTGETLLPFRMTLPLQAVIPCDTRRPLNPAQIEAHPGLERWWTQATSMWEENRSSEKLSLMAQLDFQSKLSKQLPIPELRIVYNRSGMHVVSGKVSDRRAILSSGLYWMPAYSDQEANYLCAILNSSVTTELVRPLMSYGKDERDIAKHIWELPIQRFDAEIASHRRLSEIGSTLEVWASKFVLTDSRYFAALRQDMREELQRRDDAREADEIVFEMIG